MKIHWVKIYYIILADSTFCPFSSMSYKTASTPTTSPCSSPPARPSPPAAPTTSSRSRATPPSSYPPPLSPSSICLLCSATGTPRISIWSPLSPNSHPDWTSPTCFLPFQKIFPILCSGAQKRLFGGTLHLWRRRRQRVCWRLGWSRVYPPA